MSSLLERMYAARRAERPLAPRRGHAGVRGVRPSVPSGPPDGEGLTPRQRQVLDFYTHYSRETGMPPAIREVGRQMGISSTNGVMCHVQALVRKGFLRATGEGRYQRYTVARRPGVCPFCGHERGE